LLKRKTQLLRLRCPSTSLQHLVTNITKTVSLLPHLYPNQYHFVLIIFASVCNGLSMFRKSIASWRGTTSPCRTHTGNWHRLRLLSASVHAVYFWLPMKCWWKWSQQKRGDFRGVKQFSNLCQNWCFYRKKRRYCEKTPIFRKTGVFSIIGRSHL